MRQKPVLFLSPILALLASQTFACSIVLNDPTAEQINQYRSDSEPVEVHPDCSFENGQIGDSLSAGGAEDLGNGRVLQRVNRQESRVLVVDCNSREATLLEGPGIVVGSDSCGPTVIPDDLVGERAIMSLTVGDTLQELVQLAEQRGVIELDPIEYFNIDQYGEPVWPKEHINLLCGCLLYYPDSPGASQ